MLEGHREAKPEAVLWAAVVSESVYQGTGSRWAAAGFWLAVFALAAYLDLSGRVAEWSDE